MDTVAWMEPIFSYVRVGKKKGEHLAAYHLIVGIRFLSPEVAEVCGLQRTPVRDDWRAIKLALKNATALEKIFYKRVIRDKVTGEIIRIRTKWVTIRKINNGAP